MYPILSQTDSYKASTASQGVVIGWVWYRKGTYTFQLRSPHGLYPSTQVLNHVPYLYVMVVRLLFCREGQTS